MTSLEILFFHKQGNGGMPDGRDDDDDDDDDDDEEGDDEDEDDDEVCIYIHELLMMKTLK